MKNLIQLYLLLFLSLNTFSQEKEKTCSTDNCKMFKTLAFNPKNHLNIIQTPTEICTNGGFEDYEIINGETVLKNYISIVNFPYIDFNSGIPDYIPISNITNQSTRCVTVPTNFIDEYVGNINGFEQNVLRVGIRDNVTGGAPQTIAQSIKFKTNNETVLKFNYKVVVSAAADENHIGSQPYFSARVLDMNDELVSFFDVYAEPVLDCDLTLINEFQGFKITYSKNWRTGTLDISSIPNLQNFKVEFITATCGLGGHFAYAYIDDLCVQQSGSVTLNPFNIVCPSSSFDVCGTYTVPESNSTTPISVASIVLNVFDENQNIVYTSSNPINIDLVNKTFCFELNLSNFPNITNANYNVGVVVNYENSNNNDCIFHFTPANDDDAAPGYDVSFNNCDYPCDLVAQNYTTKICDVSNDNSQIQDLSQFKTNLANNSSYTFDFYNTLIGAQNQIASDKIINFTNFNLTQVNTTFYVRISLSNICFQIVTLTLELVSTPIIPINDTELLCIGESKILNAGNGYDSYNWSSGQTTQIITISQPGNYNVIVTKNHGNIICSTTKNFTVIESIIPDIQEIITVDWTDNENTITVLLNNITEGIFEYSLNGIDFQDSNTFNNLDAGEYTIFVRDKNSCGMISEDLYILTYPKFFTPNGDGYNDFWKIKFSENEPNLTIKIFDRYGKFIKQLGTNSIGWDGKYLGKDVPSSDYWFVVIRENGKEYKGHFSLKR